MIARALALTALLAAATAVAATPISAARPSQQCGQIRADYPAADGNTAKYVRIYRQRIRTPSVEAPVTPGCPGGRYAVKRYLRSIKSNRCRTKVCYERSPTGWSCGLTTYGTYMNTMRIGSCSRGYANFKFYNAQHD